MSVSTHAPSPGTISSYAETHCAICAAGWTRTGSGGEKVHVCLLDREKIWPQMVDCDRFERRDSEPGPGR